MICSIKHNIILHARKYTCISTGSVLTCFGSLHKYMRRGSFCCIAAVDKTSKEINVQVFHTVLSLQYGHTTPLVSPCDCIGPFHQSLNWFHLLFPSVDIRLVLMRLQVGTSKKDGNPAFFSSCPHLSSRYHWPKPLPGGAAFLSPHCNPPNV